jgi:Zn-finger nucleic acid-binding protein
VKCPKCESRLNKVKIKIRPEYGGDVLHDAEKTSEIELDQCHSCNGIWFDVQELDQYLDEKLVILNSPNVKDYKELDKKDGDCPRCHERMLKKPDPKGAGVTMDVCKRCKGVWLDSTEIDRIEKKNFSFGEKHALVFKNLKELFFSE